MILPAVFRRARRWGKRVPCSTLLRGEAGALVSANGTGQSAGWGSFGIYSDPVRPSQLARERRLATSATKAARGIGARLRPLERAAFFKGYAEKQYKNLIMGGSGAFGNAATRLEASRTSTRCTRNARRARLSSAARGARAGRDCDGVGERRPGT